MSTYRSYTRKIKEMVSGDEARATWEQAAELCGLINSGGSPPRPSRKLFVKKFTEIPAVGNYREDQDEEYFRNWPSTPIPTKPETKVDVGRLKEIVKRRRLPNKHLENLVIRDLEEGASLYQKEDAKRSGCAMNAPSAFEHGERMSDALASWVSDGRYK